MGEGAASSATRFQLCALLILISRTTILCQSISSSSPLWEEEVSCNTNNNKAALFVFGDSLYDPGNNNYISTTNTDFQANFRPYGESFFTQPTGRFSDGRLIPDFICEYARLPIIPPYLKPGKHHFVYGANFASGGAGALDETYPGLVVNLNTQLNQFKNVANQLKQQLGDEEASDLLSQSVYMISIGGNDYLSPTRGDSQQSYTQEQYRNMIIGNLTSVIKAIYKTGGRKFSFITLPPLGCWPSIKAQNAANKTYRGDFCNKDLAALVQEHSKEVSEKLQKLEKALEGFKYSVFDLQTTFNDRMMNPSKYGFKNGDSACCGSGPYRGVYSCGGMRGIRDYELCENASEYLFFDSNHPSEVAYQQLAKLMWEGNSSITGPYNLKGTTLETVGLDPDSLKLQTASQLVRLEHMLRNFGFASEEKSKVADIISDYCNINIPRYSQLKNRMKKDTPQPVRPSGFLSESDRILDKDLINAMEEGQMIDRDT